MLNKDLWFEYNEGRRTIRWPLLVYMASYTYDATGGLIAWAGEIQNPCVPVMFLLTRIVPAYGAGLMSFPHNVISDGGKWCPLIKGNDKKFHSYPTGYTGAKLTSEDKLMIMAAIKKYANDLLGG